MKRHARILTILMLTASPAMALELSGAIGPYQVEMALERSDGRLVGRYRYAGQSAWLSLTGETFGTEALRLEERDGDRVTGQFFLEHAEQGFAGFWAGDESDFAVNLTPTTGQTDEMFAPMRQSEVSPTLTGQYHVGSHWVNDWFAPNYEIGFNGGQANVVELSPGTILVAFEFVVGPTYHIATFFGQATQVDDGAYVHDAVLSGGSDPCRLEFRFYETQLTINDTGNGFACQFGARAHANFGLEKVSDTAEFDTRW
ncbi:MAG: hypothetical protein AAFW64_11315 [Pseudomonadota bacterium]